MRAVSSHRLGPDSTLSTRYLGDIEQMLHRSELRCLTPIRDNLISTLQVGCEGQVD